MQVISDQEKALRAIRLAAKELWCDAGWLAAEALPILEELAAAYAKFAAIEAAYAKRGDAAAAGDQEQALFLAFDIGELLKR